ncbi:MAG: hypothetical protein Q9220_000384 [cf. Caloplaca sp. 1 TL-2023]
MSTMSIQDLQAPAKTSILQSELTQRMDKKLLPVDAGFVEVDDIDAQSVVPETADNLKENGALLDEEEDQDSDNESVASDDSDMEPFEDYKSKIERLLGDFGFEDFSIEELQHGYKFQNCVYALTSASDPQKQYILRVPVLPDLRPTDGKCEVIESDVALLGFLHDKLSVPRVKAYSLTEVNALGKPFTIQTRIPGVSLGTIYSDLDQEVKFAIVDQVVDLLAKIESIQFPHAGIFAPSSPLPDQMSDFLTPAPPSIKLFNEGDTEHVKTAESRHNRIGSNIYSFLDDHVQGWIEHELKIDAEREYDSVILGPLANLARITDALNTDGDQKSYPIVLHHWDLEPRNIMVAQNTSTGLWEITGIIDWDDALALPLPLSRRPPEWLWTASSEPQDDFRGYYNNDHHPATNLSDSDLALKNYFDTKAAKSLDGGYVEDAYGRGRWLRRCWLFARRGFQQCSFLALMEKLEKDLVNAGLFFEDDEDEDADEDAVEDDDETEGPEVEEDDTESPEVEDSETYDSPLEAEYTRTLLFNWSTGDPPLLINWKVEDLPLLDYRGERLVVPEEEDLSIPDTLDDDEENESPEVVGDESKSFLEDQTVSEEDHHLTLDSEEDHSTLDPSDEDSSPPNASNTDKDDKPPAALGKFQPPVQRPGSFFPHLLLLILGLGWIPLVDCW